MMETFVLEDKHMQSRIPSKISLPNYFKKKHEREDGEVRAFTELWKGFFGVFL